jgi:polyhydroxybutyrate depolymerase
VARALLFGALLLACASSTHAPPTTPGPDDAEAPRSPDARAPVPPDAPTSVPDALGPDLGVAVDGAPTADLPPTGTPGSAGCRDGAGLPEGEATISAGGSNRTYLLRLPAGYTRERAWPLVLALHPNGGAGIGYWDATSGARSIRALARDRAIVVLPLARPLGGGWDWRGDLPADLAFFDALIDRLETQLCVDTKRIFSMGFSGGGSFSGVLACRRKDIRAFASGSGVAYYDPKDCVGTSAAWLTVGADPEEMIPARAAFRDFFVARAGCQATTTPTAPATCLAYACPKETPVHYCVHPGGHLWPDYGTQAVWTFFQQF